ncbi:MAG: HEAT repeat domain-containing protein [Anaerolineae bacterium]|nr:HEAT repeat domain-containing protein [Anaerolineae bacterium]
MGFDVENFGMGLLAGWASAYGVYRARHLIKRGLNSLSQQASSAQSYATQSADRRYINAVVQLAQTSHLAGRFVHLSQIIVEPRFLPAPTLAAPLDEDAEPSVFDIVPHIVDHPYLSAPYNLPTFSIDDLGAGERRLALLGGLGSGRTTALFAILLRALGELEFRKLPDKVQQRLDAEEAALDEKQRAVRVRERLIIEQKAKEKLAEEKGVSFESADTSDRLPLFNRLMPVYLHLADLNTGDAEFGSEIDPAEPLVRAVQRQLGRVAASTVPANLYRRLGEGQALLLIDGLDDLPEAERPRHLAWLQALLREYGDNFFIVAGPAVGYGALTARLGLTPIFMRPWSENDVQLAAEGWAQAWPKIAGTRRAPAAPPDSNVVAAVRANARALSPLDLTLKIWAHYANDADDPGFEGYLRAFVVRHLSADQSFGLLLPQLTAAGALQLDEGCVTAARLAGSAMPVSADDEPDMEAEPAAKKETDNAQIKLLNGLHRAGLLTRWTGGRYQFRHPAIAAYLASLSFQNEPERLLAKAALPAWRQAIAYAALHQPMDELVRIRLNAPPDIAQFNALEIAHWLPFASADAPWRAGYIKHIATLMAAPTQYPLVRERAAAAMVTTRDPGVVGFLRNVLRARSPHLRRLACLTLGAVGSDDATSEIISLLSDDDGSVKLAAALALGALRSEESLVGLVEAFTEGEDITRQAIAETFADIPEEGLPILYDAIHDEDMMLRRAAVLGLRRIDAPWAFIAIYSAFLEDEQWYVRSAAQLAFQEKQSGRRASPRSYPPAESLDWLAQWATSRGENVPPGAGAEGILLKALQEGDQQIKVYAADNLAHLGVVATTKPLYSALRDRQADVREAAHRALSTLQLQIGQPLPG